VAFCCVGRKEGGSRKTHFYAFSLKWLRLTHTDCNYKLKVVSKSIDCETTADNTIDLEEEFNLFLVEAVRIRRRKGKLIHLARAINLILVSVIAGTGTLNRYISTRATSIAS
jgi:hypothetical protein